MRQEIKQALRDLGTLVVNSVQEGLDAALNEVRYSLEPEGAHDEEDDEEEPFDWEAGYRYLVDKVSFLEFELKQAKQAIENFRPRILALEQFMQRGEVVTKTAGEIDRLYGFYRDNLQKIIGMFNELERKVDDVAAGRQVVGTICLSDSERAFVREVGLGGGSLQEAGAAACDAQKAGEGGRPAGAEAGREVAVQPGGGAVPAVADGGPDVPGTVPGG